MAGLVVPTPAYVRFATHYGFRPDFCEGADPESKGLVENLVGYVKSDLMVPEELSVVGPGDGERQRIGLVQRGQRRHALRDLRRAVRAASQRTRADGRAPITRAQIGKVVTRKVDRLSCVRFGSARYSVPNARIGKHGANWSSKTACCTVTVLGQIVATHASLPLVRPPFCDEHYGGPRPMPTRAVRPKTATEKAFCALGPVAESFIKGAAARGMTSLKGDLEELAQLQAAHGDEVLVAALDRAVAFGRFRAHDVRSIIAAGLGVPRPAGPVMPSLSTCRSSRFGSLSDYAIGERS